MLKLGVELRRRKNKLFNYKLIGLLNISRSSTGEYVIEYFGKKWVFYIYLCRKTNSTLQAEVSAIEKSITGIFSLIPNTLIKTFFSIIQGTLHFLIHRDKFRKARNKGLFLSMLILGKDQLKEVIDELEEHFNKCNQYYLVIIDPLEKPVLTNCYSVDYECGVNEINVDILKNIYVLLDKL